MKIKNIYLDNAAATPIDGEVFSIYKNSLLTNYANASALHSLGVDSKELLNKARTSVAKNLHATQDSIVFTRGGTESINMAILGAARANKKHGNHIITTRVEHDAVLASMNKLKQEGFKISYLEVDNFGNIDINELKKLITKKTILVSIMYVQNEIGNIYDINEIGKFIIKFRKQNNSSYPLLHSDACQAPNYIDLRVEQMHVDLLSLNGSKIYGIKSSGILYKRRGIKLESILFGGKQEKGIRPGTEDVASAVSFAKAFDKAQELVSSENIRLKELNNLFINLVNKNIKDIVINGPEIDKSPPTPPKFGGSGGRRVVNNINISFIDADSETVLIYLGANNIYAGSGSACSTDKDEPSHVLKACNKTKQELMSSVRFTLGRNTTKKDIIETVKILSKTITRVREINKIK